MNDENQEFLDENLENKGSGQLNPENNSEFKTLEEKTVTDELAEMKDRNLRLFAEFENFRKRTAKEKLDFIKYANESLLLDMLPVLDDLERAMKMIESSEDKNLIQGVELIQNKLIQTLNNKGLKKIEVNQGDLFDVEIHEAITRIESPEDNMSGKIIDIIETGYQLNDKVIRFAKVVVGK